MDVLATSDAETTTEGPEREPAAPAPQDDTTATTEEHPAERAPPATATPDPSPPTAPDQEPGPDDETTDYGAPLWGRNYVVVAITENGQPKPLVPDRRPWTTHFSHKKIDDNPSLGDVGWRWGGCNGGAADVEVTPDRLQVGHWRSTAIGCPGEEAEADSWAMEFFVSDPYWRVEDDRLWLWSGDTIVELEESPDD